MGTMVLGIALPAIAQVDPDPPTVIPPMPARAGGAPAPARLAAAALVPAGVAVGRTAGSFAVSSTGSATYEIPLWTPPGVAGLTPALALSYSSAAGDAIAGVGWSVTGQSSISRCYTTYAQDSIAGPPQLAATDRFCIDGKKLRSFGGTTYGADGAFYQTEIADFSLVISHGVSGTGPTWFEVRAKNGLIYEYGNTTDSRIFPGSSTSARTWALNKIRDRVGNYVAFAYINDTTNGVFRSDSITYTTSAAGTANYQVKFSYVARTDILTGAVDGTVFQEPNRLSQIAINLWNGSAYATLVKQYVLTYGLGSSSGRSQLQSVQECSPTQCFLATTISYQNGAPGWTSAGSVPSSVIPLDLNGDGIEDLVYVNATTNTWYYLLGQSSGTYAGPYDTGMTAVNSAKAVRIDFYGTGQFGLLVPNTSGNWRALRFQSAGAAFTYVDTTTPATYAAAGNVAVADLNGDGLPDLVYGDAIGGSEAANIYYRLNTGGAFGAETLLRAANLRESFGTAPLATMTNYAASINRKIDFNGDGREDVVVWTKNCIYGTGLCTPAQLTFSWTVLVSKADGTYVRGAKIAMGGTAPIYPDMNGDGCSDFVHDSGAPSYYLTIVFAGCTSSTDAAFAGTSVTTLSTLNAGGLLAADWNGDGMDDVLLYNTATSTWGYALSNGLTVGSWTNLGYTGAAVAVTDLNGDGLPDLLLGTTARIRNGVVADLASSFVDGFGITATPSYAALPQTPSYTKGTGATLPEQDYQGPLQVVTAYSASDGIGGTFTVSETYGTARVNVQGRGFEGFGWTQAQDSRNHFYLKSQYAQSFPQTGMLQEQTVYQSNGTTPISDVLNTLPAAAVLDATVNNKRYFPYISQSVNTGYELNGALNGQIVTQVTKAFSYLNGSSTTDLYGNLWKITTTTVDKDTTSPWFNSSYTDTLNITPHEDGTTGATGWCIGLSDQVTEQRTIPGPASLTHTTAYGVSTDGLCRVLTQTVEPSSSTNKIVTAYGYTDGCNNINTVTITGQTPGGTAMAPRGTSMGYGTKCLLPETVTNALSQTTQFGYRYDLGLRTSATDPNGLAISWLYNDLGQIQAEMRPDGTQASYSLSACSGTGCLSDASLRYVVQRSEQDASAGHATFWYTQDYFDAFGRQKYDRPVQSNGIQVQSSVSFDSRGRVVTRTNPSGNGFASYNTTLNFDDLGRLTSESRPVSATNPSLESTTYTYQGRTRTITDPRGYTTKRQFDVIGELSRVTDPDGVSQTGYSYTAFSALAKVTDPAGNVTNRGYDSLGYLLASTSDPDRGSWTYQYDSLGELINVRDAKTVSPAWTQQLTYDPLGRLTQRAELEGTTTWTWGSVAANHEIGQLRQISGLGDTETSTFDSVGRPASHTMLWGGTTYVIGYAYNSLGKLDTLTYPLVPGQPNPFQVKYGYSSGYPSAVQNYTGNIAGTTFWQLTPGVINMDPWGHVADETLGTTTPVRVQSTFDAVTSWIATRQVGSGGGTSNLQSLAYQWDLSGNLSQRQDLKQSLTEVFANDNLNRLQSSTLNGVTNFSVAIDPTGNITSRTEGGITFPYSYDATHKHAVANVNGTVYGYDANGNMATRAGHSIAWASYNLPTLINSTGVSASFSYGPDRQRKQQVSTYTADGTVGTETTIYVGGMFEVETTPGQTHYKHYVSVPGGTRVIYDLQSVSGAQTTYVTADHLGSGNLYINNAGAVQINESYSAYGYRRSSNWASPLSASSGDYAMIASTTRRGYTDAFHEMLDNVGLVHMNGRLYDPVIGRFLSADPLPGIENQSQSWNPYGYVSNRPLSSTDPTGLEAEDSPQNVVKPEGADPGNSDSGSGSTGRGGGGDSSVIEAGHAIEVVVVVVIAIGTAPVDVPLGIVAGAVVISWGVGEGIGHIINLFRDSDRRSPIARLAYPQFGLSFAAGSPSMDGNDGAGPAGGNTAGGPAPSGDYGLRQTN